MSTIDAISSSSRVAGLPLRAPQGPGEAVERLAPDRVTLSGEARARLAAGEGGSSGGTGESGGSKTSPGGLSPEQQQEVAQLRQRDAAVRQHEAAHQAAGGQLTGPASFSYQSGPDGKSYAIGGEVQISAGAGRTPDETIALARQVRSAALAPADPSSADLSAAASASQMEAQALQQKQASPSDGAAAQGGATAPGAAPAPGSGAAVTQPPAQGAGSRGAAKQAAAEPRLSGGGSFSLEQVVIRRTATA